MPAYNLPPNPYVTVFDFRLQFDLNTGTIKIDLSPSQIRDESGVAGVQVEIIFPDKTKYDPGFYVFAPPNMNNIFSVPLPKVQQIFMWGMYKVTCTLFMNDTTYYPNTKTRNICAPNKDDPYALDMKGSIDLTVDCMYGTLMARGFSGYAYMGMPPVSESYNITRYYPPEAELLPQKGISIMPFVVDAYVGLNTVKGVNIAMYDFTDNVFVILRIVATAEKKIRCGADMAQIYCGMKSLSDQLHGCNATQQEWVMAFGEINALVWIVTVGISENKDVEENIDRLEKLLGVECRCSACAGEKVGPSCLPTCPQVKATAVVNPGDGAVEGRDVGDGAFIDLNFQGDAGADLQIKWRPFCDPATNEPYTQLPNVTLDGSMQNLTIDVPSDGDYQLMLTTIAPDGTYCPPLIIIAEGNCPAIVGINTPPPVPPIPTFIADWGWSPTPFTTANIVGFNWQRNATFEENSNIVADFDAAPDNTSYMAFRYPKTEPVKLHWENTNFNKGAIPDAVFTSYTDANFIYVFSKVFPALDSTSRNITLKP